MDRLFALQLVTSFFAGGSGIALLTFIAERSHSRIAGIIVSLPVAMVIGLFFVGWTLSPQAVADALPVIPIAEGITLLFVVVYVYAAALLPLPRAFSVVVSLLLATSTWLLFAAPLAMFQLSNIGLSLVGFCVLALVSHYFLAVRVKDTHTSLPPLTYTVNQKIGRALFVGCVMTLIVFLSKTLGPLWGGIFSVYPAAYTSTLLILHKNYDASFLFRTCRTMPLGSLTILLYGFAAAYTFPQLGIVLGTIVSYFLTGVLFALLLWTRNPRESNQ